MKNRLSQNASPWLAGVVRSVLPKLAVICAIGSTLAFSEGSAEIAHGLGAWQATWATAPQLVEPANLPPEPGFVDTTLRQTFRVSIGGRRIRVKLSNAFGNAPLHVLAAHVALATKSGTPSLVAESGAPLSFHGEPHVTIPPGALFISDPVDFNLPPMADVAVSLHVKGAPSDVTGHPGSRTTSFLERGDHVSASTLSNATPTDHWYFASAIDVFTDSGAGAVAVIGDSLTDGRGSTTNGNNRWPDQLAGRLAQDPETRGISMLNLGIGGNRVLTDGLGPSVLARLDRDVIAQPGVRWLIVFEGVNDIGTAGGARAKGERGTTARDLIMGLEQIAIRAQARGLPVYGATLLPFGGSSYDRPGCEADRQEVNLWIRTSGVFDAVLDFDAAVRDPQDPSKLAAAYDVGDHLHLSVEGYRRLAEAVPLDLFAQ